MTPYTSRSYGSVSKCFVEKMSKNKNDDVCCTIFELRGLNQEVQVENCRNLHKSSSGNQSVGRWISAFDVSLSHHKNVVTRCASEVIVFLVTRCFLSAVWNRYMFFLFTSGRQYKCYTIMLQNKQQRSIIIVIIMLPNRPLQKKEGTVQWKPHTLSQFPRPGSEFFDPETIREKEEKAIVGGGGLRKPSGGRYTFQGKVRWLAGKSQFSAGIYTSTHSWWIFQRSSF